MKNLYLLLATMLASITMVHAQQHFSTNKSTDIEHRVGIVGIGSLNTEELSKINSSGKFAAYFVPFLVDLNTSKRQWTYRMIAYTSYNINATNNDSLLPSTILFPELGKSSFLGTLEMGFVTYNSGTTSLIDKSKQMYNISVLGEFSVKNVNIDNDDTSIYFNTLNYTLGLKLMSTRFLKIDGMDMPVSLSLIPYLQWVNIPNEDNGDYRYALDGPDEPGRPVSPSELFGAGAKVIFAVNDFQFFADFRQVFDKHNNIRNRNLKGFSSNIGVVVSASILEFN